MILGRPAVSLFSSQGGSRPKCSAYKHYNVVLDKPEVYQWHNTSCLEIVRKASAKFGGNGHMYGAYKYTMMVHSSQNVLSMAIGL